jgi:hypothetical protein
MKARRERRQLAMMDRFFAIMFTLIGAAALAFLFIVVAYAHGVEQWIADQQLSDPVLRTYCCGPSDCQQLSNGTVIETEGGYLVPVVQGREFVAAKRALPFAPDGHYHACYRYDDAQHNTVRCLIVPPPSS